MSATEEADGESEEAKPYLRHAKGVEAVTAGQLVYSVRKRIERFVLEPLVARASLLLLAPIGGAGNARALIGRTHGLEANRAHVGGDVRVAVWPGLFEAWK